MFGSEAYVIYTIFAYLSISYFVCYSSDLKWIPIQGQEGIFGENSPSPVSQTILLNKMTPGDEVIATCVAVKGIGRDHAKFSPVSAAFYKFHSRIRILRPVEGEEAEKLKASFVPGVIEIDYPDHVARVAQERLDNGSRDYERLLEFETREGIEAGIDSNHIIFQVETTSASFRPPHSIVRAAFNIMLCKCAHYLAIIRSPGFSDSNFADFDETSAGQTSGSLAESQGKRAFLNGREVGLDLIHQSLDGRVATFTFYGEDHTLGAALRFCILQR
ncbi:unnamed protein product [Protopolystoma xenopodis]|uniref:DNA-directed RNA polymerase RpoA/D/Rpb3-type domain-containing protein n=1 Tax=Protopolystoma xenopodis TaxID=117903 RepID=A0A448XM71_9PLAT|nr:unnamed protein product [Protopolystoma xenopodis]